MKNRLVVLAAALLLAVVPFSCYFAHRLTARLGRAEEIRRSREAVIRNARSGLERLRVKYGEGGPDARWNEEDAETYRVMRAALARERVAP